MSSSAEPVIANHEDTKLKLSSYIVGFISSIALTLFAYLAVTQQAYSRDGLIGLVTGLALIQFMVQLLFFLHLGRETRPRWKLSVFFFMLAVVLILVFGSLWIMTNLNVRQTIPQQLQYMNNQDGL